MKHCKEPAPGAGRQLSLMFEASHVDGLDPSDRDKAVSALARILMQAAGIPVEESADDRR